MLTVSFKQFASLQTIFSGQNGQRKDWPNMRSLLSKALQRHNLKGPCKSLPFIYNFQHCYTVLFVCCTRRLYSKLIIIKIVKIIFHPLWRTIRGGFICITKRVCNCTDGQRSVIHGLLGSNWYTSINYEPLDKLHRTFNPSSALASLSCISRSFQDNSTCTSFSNSRREN